MSTLGALDAIAARFKQATYANGMIALQLQGLSVDRSTRPALALQVAERLVQLSRRTCEAADDGDKLAAFTFVEPNL